MQATLPVRTFNPWLAFLALAVAAAIFVAAAVVVVAPRLGSPAVDAPAKAQPFTPAELHQFDLQIQARNPSGAASIQADSAVADHIASEHADNYPVTAPQVVSPSRDDGIGSSIHSGGNGNPGMKPQ
jgi:hypothetical protein